MSNIKFYIVLFSLLLFSCGVKKDVQVELSTIDKTDQVYTAKFHEGIRLKFKGRIDESIVKLEECLTMRQDDDAVYYALSQLELSKGNYEKSAAHILKAAELDPSNTWYIQELAYMHYEQGNYAESADNFKKLVEIEPRNVDWQYGYAEALLRTGEKEKAIEALNKTEDQVGINPSLSIEKYNLYMEMKEVELAEQELNKARVVFPKDLQLLATLVDHYFKLGQEEKGISMLEKLVEEDPSNGRAHLALADIYRQQGKVKESYKELAIAFEANDVDLDTKMKILINIHETTYKIEPEVYELVEQIVKAHPHEAKAHSIKGDYLLRAEKTDEALQSYVRALDYDKSQFPIWNQVLIMEYQAADYAALLEHSDQCLALFPTMSTVYLLNGVAANQLKKFSQASDNLYAGIELVVNDPVMKAEFYGQIGEAHFGLNETREGIEAYKKAVNLDKQSSLLKNNFAFRLAFSKVELDLAKSMAEQAVEMAPGQSQFIDTYGLVMFQKGEFEEAKKLFESAYDINEADVLINEHLGDVHFKLGKIDDAVKWWKKAKELNSKNTVIDKKIADKKYYDPIY